MWTWLIASPGQGFNKYADILSKIEDVWLAGGKFHLD